MTDQQQEYEKICDAHLNKPISVGELACALKAFLPLKATASEELPAAVAVPGEGTPAITTASAEVRVKWPELLGRLKGAMEDAWLTLRDTPNMSDVEEFAGRLAEWAEVYQAAPLGEFTQRLQQQVDEFDLEQLPQTLESFPNVIEAISNQAEKS